jgi:hypothetical protein
MLTKVIAGMAAGQGDGGDKQPIQIQLVLDGNVLADQILELDRNNSRTAVA